MRLKTVCMVTLLLLATASGVDGQVRVGVLGGLNLSSYKADEQARHSSRTGAVLGGVVDLDLGNNIGLRLEPMYIQKGGKGEDTSTDERATLKSSLIELPVFLTLGWGEATRPYLLVGPSSQPCLHRTSRGT